jgi:dienelactone hydrolase
MTDNQSRRMRGLAGRLAAACWVWAAVGLAAGFSLAQETVTQVQRPQGPPLAGTLPLTLDGDIADQMIEGVDRFLLGELDQSIAGRGAYWQRDLSSAEAYAASIEPNRQRLARIIGLRDERLAFDDLELVATLSEPALVGRGEGYQVFAIRWPALEGVHGEGLLLEPVGRPPAAGLVVIPDCEQSPEQLVGLLPGVAPESQIARRLAESGCRVIVPALVNRGHELSVIAGGRRASTATHREILYRAAYQMGRHLIGYEVHKVLAAVDWLKKSSADDGPIGVVGYGEGGLLALCAAAVDPRIDVAGVSGYFDSRQGIWREPIDRNLFGLLREFGDAEIASLIAPRALVIEACAAPVISIAAGGDSAPADRGTPAIESVRAEVARARELTAGLQPSPTTELVVSGDGNGPFGGAPFLELVLRSLGDVPLASDDASSISALGLSDPVRRHARQFTELAAFSQDLVEDSPRVRAEFTAGIDRSSGIEQFQESVGSYRQEFRERIIGAFDRPLSDPAPRTRLAYDTPGYLGYEVVLDVFPDVMLYGILLVPQDLATGERRPVVVCQHGLEGRAQYAVEGDYTSYRGFAAKLADQGFVTFAPQHLYRGGDRFRTLQRKANPLGRSLFAVMTAQHKQLLAWLGGLEFVDADRIAFYGISYGGKSAMRIPAVLDGYCLSICSSDFSNWIWRTVSNRFESGYLAHAEYEIFEFDLGNTFNYGEMAALICPRPFMVERFHHHGLVADLDSAEFGRVRLLYENLGIADRARMSYFGSFQPPEPHGERETFDFLRRQLNWP